MSRQFNSFIKYLGEYIANISPTFFIVSSLSFIVYFALENFKVGLISNYFDLNLLMLVALASGLVAIFYYENRANLSGKNKPYLFSLFFAIILGLFLAKYLADFGKIGLFTAVCGSISVYLIIDQMYDSRRQN
ncbi:MAG: hypothetical protein Q8P32_01730 [Candidatus Komeilibacteria bacterium]|nr:hypothetical protein [Candidatus Komeilibacteria bacterium]